MKKIGLLSMHCTINYGASLQALSLYKYLEKRGYDITIINYRPKYLTDIYEKNHENERKKVKTKLKYLVVGKRYKKRFDAFRKFENYLKLSKTCYTYEDLQNLKESYDIYICGSDQIWNPINTQYDKAFFFGFVNRNALKLSYAASIGQDKLDEQSIQFISENIKRFQGISVREKSAKDLLEREMNTASVQNIDPVFLTSTDEWKTYEIPIKTPPKYILLYAIGMQPLSDELVREIKNKSKVQCITIQYNAFKDKNTDYLMDDIGPGEFLYLLRNAEYVVTNSFHGIALSLLFKKKLVAYRSLDRNTRIESLLQLVGMTDLQISSIEEYKAKDWDRIWEQYKNIDVIIEKEIEKADLYFKENGL